MKSMRARALRSVRTVSAAACLGAAGLLAACGSATVENQGGSAEQTSVAPLERTSASESAGATESTESSSAAASSSANSSASAARSTGASASDAPQGQDKGAHEVSEVPAPEAASDEADKTYLDALAKAGVNVEGVQDQLIGTGNSVCNGDDITVPAVAGQLIEQNRSTLGHEELVTLMQDQARKAYC